MSLRKISFFILSFVLVFSACKKDDDSTESVIEEVRDRAEQQVIDDATLQEYLETHYYNKSAFDGNLNPKISDLSITEVPEDITISSDADSLLINVVETKTVDFADTDYKVYIFRINQGGGLESPKFTDNIDVIYEGFSLEGEVFDSRVNLENDGFDLLNLIPGWRKVLPEFNTAESFIEEPDGTVNYQNHGTGVMFLPSGLAYFSNATTGISAYEPIAFKFELIRMSENDHDGDGIPSYLEDLDGDGEFSANADVDILDDDSDSDGLPNYVDSDDDGDGVLTIDEDINGDGDPTNDIGANGIANYLDPEETASKP